MRTILSTLIAIAVLSSGCSSRGDSKNTVTANEHSIIRTLFTRDRNAVHVALWTLDKNGIPTVPAISYDSPYSEVQPRIQAVGDYLRTLPQDRLAELDKSLTYHWNFYSPIWSSQDWP
jgi:hypothetical protein